jgi:hypothetical protein
MTPAQPIQAQDAPQLTAPAQDSTQADSRLPDENAVSEQSVNLQRSYSKINEAIRKLADGLGVPRNSTIPHVEGQSMADHIAAVGQVLASHGGITSSVLTATHTKHDSGGGSTVAHHSQKLKEVIVPKDWEDAKAAVAAERSFISKCAILLGDDDPAIKLAKSHIALIGRANLAGMTVFDAAVALLSIPGPLIQSIARAHSGTKDGGHAPHLRAPRK